MKRWILVIMLLLILLFSSGCTVFGYQGPKIEGIAYVTAYDEEMEEPIILEFDFGSGKHRKYKTDGYLFDDDLENIRLFAAVNEEGVTEIYAIQNGMIEPFDTRIDMTGVVRIFAYYDENLYYLRDLGKLEIVRADVSGINTVYGISDRSFWQYKSDADMLYIDKYNISYGPWRHICNISKSGRIIYENKEKVIVTRAEFGTNSTSPLYCANVKGENEYICEGMSASWYNDDVIVYDYGDKLFMRSISTGEIKCLGQSYFEMPNGSFVGEESSSCSVNKGGAITRPSRVGTLFRGMYIAIVFFWPETGDRSAAVIDVPDLSLREIEHVYWE